MIQAILAILVLVPPAPDMDGAIEAVRAKRFVEALLAAEAEPDPSRRAEAVLYVRHHAGDLDGALRVAAAARRDGFSTPWLEEREAFVALSLRDIPRTRLALEALARRPEHGGAQVEELARGYTSELEDMERLIAARDRGITLGQLTIAAAALLALAILVAPGLTRGRARPSP